MDLNEIQYFKFVAEAGSFSLAAKQTGIPKSTLSRKVSELESRLGVTLLKRTTRQIKLTDIGQEYLQICKKSLAELEEAEALAARSGTLPRGRLRVAAPLDIGTTYLAEVAAQFLQKYPDIEIDFILNDEILDLIDRKIDVAVRAGPLEDSSLRSVKLGAFEFQLFASPQYLRRFGEPKTPQELQRHRGVFFTSLGSEAEWNLLGHSGNLKVKAGKRIFCDSLNMAKHLAIQGAGIALIPVFLGHEEVQKKLLVRVLKNWGMDREPVHLVYPDQPYLPQKTRLFIECLKKAFD